MGGGGGEAREREKGRRRECQEHGRLGWRKQELYGLIKLFYRTHIAVKSIVGQLLFNATAYRYDVTVV